MGCRCMGGVQRRRGISRTLLGNTEGKGDGLGLCGGMGRVGTVIYDGLVSCTFRIEAQHIKEFEGAWKGFSRQHLPAQNEHHTLQKSRSVPYIALSSHQPRSIIISINHILSTEPIHFFPRVNKSWSRLAAERTSAN